MDEAQSLGDYMPVSYRNQLEDTYVGFLWSTFEFNYGAGKYEFASFAFHLLYMTYMSFVLWQIRVVRLEAFGHALIGFQREAEMDLLAADTPFKFYDRLKESQILRFLKIIGCENDQVGEIAKFVRRRNKIAHPTGSVFFNDKATIDDEISGMMAEVVKLEAHMQPVVFDIYRRFLLDSANIEEREYGSDPEEIEANLIHRVYMSRRDLEICAAMDISDLAALPAFVSIASLHAAVRTYLESGDEAMPVPAAGGV